ncbi:glycosyltransferase [Polaromonas sp. P1(28)-8]|nr:glycosyltransferase [Polaromonas sp. P1(28)-8]
MDGLVHPTLEDTFAMVVLEAMAYGLPVVVSGPRYCGISGLLQDGVNAMILEDPRDANKLAQLIQQVMGQPALQDRLMQGATEFARHYQWREIALQQEALYFAALAALKKRPAARNNSGSTTAAGGSQATSLKCLRLKSSPVRVSSCRMKWYLFSLGVGLYPGSMFSSGSASVASHSCTARGCVPVNGLRARRSNWL